MDKYAIQWKPKSCLVGRNLSIAKDGSEYGVVRFPASTKYSARDLLSPFRRFSILLLKDTTEYDPKEEEWEDHEDKDGQANRLADAGTAVRIDRV